MKNLTIEELEQVVAGNKQAGEIFINAASGAVEGTLMCFDAGVEFADPWAIAGCAAGGAVLGAFFPH